MLCGEGAGELGGGGRRGKEGRTRRRVQEENAIMRMYCKVMFYPNYYPN
jgi:hypothetical protein